MASASLASARTRRLFDVALFVWGAAAAVNLAATGANDARQSAGWPYWLELVYLCSFLLAVPALAVAAWAKRRLKRHGAVVEDERTVDTHLRSLAAALAGVLAVQLPYFFQVETPSAAQAKFTVAAALVVYGAARLWFNREA
ncbi:hypothetical protein [Actinoplanes xinjiangensis]|uniref:Uncharacterized protein n=1 Tax=Actinoplanes xinjiangensis TaxID=512350 RepID=A0A316EU13_9ACTN|nr:hypothetical protein [Actinoplanes xinjiangensis]PWK36134.1 hypothetical protein BC793_124115 [Actinoplanes xinjiangensis]GIF42860.1 hypothetical protein Axi01nite_71710 [Actinoplanes xinjiangensis]